MSKPLESDELKALKGQEVWLIPLDNAIQRKTPLIEQITSDIVEKCGSKMFHLKKSGGYYFDDGYCNSNNYGYLPFKTKQDALDYLEVKDFLSKIKYEDLSYLEIDNVRKIKEIIENKTQQKVTTWYLVNEDESHYSCNNCGYDFLLANESSLSENSINFCPSCGYKIEEIIEIFNQQKNIHDTQSKEDIIKERINLKTCKPTHDFDYDKLKSILSKIWEHIECNYDKKVERVIVIGTDAQFYISYPLDDSQNERLKDNFNIICSVDSYSDFALITLDI